MWESMTVDEFAGFEKANGSRVVLVDGVWWKMIRPFFYRPLHPFTEIARGSKTPPAGSIVGGFQHLLPEGEAANSRMNLLVVDEIKGYCLECLSYNNRRHIKKALSCTSVREVDDLEEFISSGHKVYLDFYARTKYPYRKERLDKEQFARWGRTLFSFPKVRILGAYRNGNLCALNVSYLVEDVLYDATLFADTESLQYCAPDSVYHDIRVRAACCNKIKRIYKGQLSGERGLDFFKLRRGVKVLSKPAYFRANPLAFFMLKKFMPAGYSKLLGTTLESLEGRGEMEGNSQSQTENDA